MTTSRHNPIGVGRLTPMGWLRLVVTGRSRPEAVIEHLRNQGLSLFQVSEPVDLNFRPDLEASRKLVTIFLSGDDSVFAKSDVSR